MRRDFRAVQTAVASGVVPSRSKAADHAWARWLTFCSKLAIDPLLSSVQDAVPILQLFGHGHRTGKLAPNGNPVRSRTVEDTIRHVAQSFASMGANDPRLNSFGKTDFRLTRQFKSYTKADPPPDRVKPVPVPVIQHIMNVAHSTTNEQHHAISDMIALAFFFLLRPGEYTDAPSSETTPFRFQDVELFIGRHHRIDLTNATDAEIKSATFVQLTFTSQKNGVKGEVIGLGRSGSQLLCPVLAAIRRVLHLRMHNGNPAQALARYFVNGEWKPVLPKDITAALRLAVTILGPGNLGFTEADISARSLRAAGAMALLCAQVDTDHIRLIGRWRSDEMLRYLHVQAEPFMRDFASKMLSGGAYYLLPGQDVPLN